MNSRYRISVVLLALCLAASGVASTQQDPDPYAGHFRHTEFDIVLMPMEGVYEGWITIRARGERYDVHARKVDDRLEGYFMMDGGRYTFTAEPDNHGLTFMMPLARTASEARRSFGRWVRQRCRARRVESTARVRRDRQSH